MSPKGLSKSPSVPVGTVPTVMQVPMDLHEELSFDTLKKRDCADKDKWMTGVCGCTYVQCGCEVFRLVSIMHSVQDAVMCVCFLLLSSPSPLW